MTRHLWAAEIAACSSTAAGVAACRAPLQRRGAARGDGDRDPASRRSLASHRLSFLAQRSGACWHQISENVSGTVNRSSRRKSSPFLANCARKSRDSVPERSGTCFNERDGAGRLTAARPSARSPTWRASRSRRSRGSSTAAATSRTRRATSSAASSARTATPPTGAPAASRPAAPGSSASSSRSSIRRTSRPSSPARPRRSPSATCRSCSRPRATSTTARSRCSTGCTA